MKTIVTEIGEGIAYYPELHDWVKGLDLNPDDAMFEPLSLMEGDPDKLKCDNRELYFMDIDLGNTKFILTSDEVNDKEKKMLTEFHQDNHEQNYSQTESKWSDFENATNVIAYRGGKGYHYYIWLYTPQTTQQVTS